MSGPLAVNGYYPLYTTATAANAASLNGDSGSHIHVFDGVTYYMPNGVPFYHGNYPTPNTINNTGLNSNIFKKRFKEIGEYTTQNFVRKEIQSNIGSGTVTQISTGTGLSGGNISQTGTISLNASLSQLNNVSTASPQNNQALVFNSSNFQWEPQAVTGASPSTITSLQDVENPTGGVIPDDSILLTQSGKVVFSPNNLINTSGVLQGEGVQIETPSQNTVRVNTNLITLPTHVSSESTDLFAIAKISGTQGITPQNTIDVTNFKNPTSGGFLINSDVVVESGNPLIKTDLSGNAFSLGICVTNFQTVDLGVSGGISGGVSGILRIPNGGTGASTSEEARNNLGVSYNRDVLPVDAPLFYNNQVGDNLRLQAPGIESFTVSIGGSGYTGSGEYTIQDQLGETFTIDTSFISVSGGSVVGISGFGTSFGFGSFFLNENNIILNNTSGGSGAEIGLSVKNSYINFGVSLGENGFGFRNNNGRIEIKNQTGSTWTNLNEGVSGIVITTPAESQLLICQSSGDFENKTVSNGISVSASGEVTVTSVDPTVITTSVGVCPISITEFSTLSGVSSNIQNQLNDRLTVNTGGASPSQGSLIYYNTSTASSQFEYTQLNLGTEGEILTSGSSVPSFSNVYSSFSSFSNFPANYEVGVFGTSQGKRVTKETFFTDSIDINTGLDYDGVSGNLKIDLGVSGGIGVSSGKLIVQLPVFGTSNPSGSYETGQLGLFDLSGTNYLGVKVSGGWSGVALTSLP